MRHLARDVQADLVQELERSHRHSEIAQRAVDGTYGLSPLDQRDGFSEVRHQHAVHEKSRRVRDKHRRFPEAPREGDHGLDGGRVAEIGADDFDQRHLRGGVEEVHPDHAARAPESLGHRAHGEGRGVGREDAALRHLSFQLPEERLLHGKILDHSLQHQVRDLQPREVQHRLDASERARHLRLGEAAARDFPVEERPRVREGLEKRLRLEIP